MPNGDGDEYNAKWCRAKHNEIKEDLAKIWGEHGFKAVWNKMDELDKKFFYIILGLTANMGGIIAVLLKMVIG